MLRQVGVELVATGQSAFSNALEAGNKSLDKMRNAAGQARDGLLNLGSGVNGIIKGIGVGLVGALGGAAIGFAAFIKNGLDMNKSVELATAQLEAFTGSSEEAARILEWVREESAKTPFAFQEMASAAAALQPAVKASGSSLEDLIKTAEILAATNPAEGLEGASFALKEALSGDYASLAERFNISRVAIQRFRDAGLEGLPLVQAAMEEMGASGDLVQKMAETTTGRLSTFQDTITNLASSASQPIFDAFGEALAYLQPILDENSEAMQAWLKDGMQGVIDGAKQLAADVMPALQTAFQFVKDAVTTFQQAMAGNWVDSDVVQPFHRLAGAAGLLVKGALEQLPGIIKFATDNFEILKGAVMGVAALLGSAAIVSALAGIGAAILAINLPLVALVAGAALLGAAWQGNWGGIRDSTMAAWDAIQPYLVQAQTWLQTNIPIAVQTAADIWQNQLLPALTQTGDWIMNTLVPGFMGIVNWIGTEVPKAAQALADGFNTHILIPAQNIWAFFRDSLIPLWLEVNETIGVAGALAIRALANVYTQNLQPAITTAQNFLRDHVLPIFKSLDDTQTKVGDGIREALTPAFDGLQELMQGALKTALEGAVTLFNNVKKALEGVGGWIQNLISYLNDLQAKMNSIDFGILTPGSPTPFEIGLKGIDQAMKDVNATTSKLATTMNRTTGAPATGALSTINNTYNNQRVVTIPVNINGSKGATPVVKDIQTGISRGLAYTGMPLGS